MSLIKAINDEVKRCNEVKGLYDALPGNQGKVGSAFIKNKIDEALDIISTGDTVGMIRVYQELKNII